MAVKPDLKEKASSSSSSRPRSRSRSVPKQFEDLPGVFVGPTRINAKGTVYDTLYKEPKEKKQEREMMAKAKPKPAKTKATKALKKPAASKKQLKLKFG